MSATPAGHNSGRLSLYVPEPTARPGHAPDFSGLDIANAGSVARPAINADAAILRDYRFTLIRILDDNGQALGDWNPKLAGV